MRGPDPERARFAASTRSWDSSRRSRISSPSSPRRNRSITSLSSASSRLLVCSASVATRAATAGSGWRPVSSTTWKSYPVVFAGHDVVSPGQPVFKLGDSG